MPTRTHTVRRLLVAATAAVAIGVLGVPAASLAQGVESSEPDDERSDGAERRAGPVWLGVAIDDESDTDGAAVERVVADSPAERAGLRAGDRILEVAGTSVDDLRSLKSSLDPYAPGDRVEVTYVRGDDEKNVRVLLSLKPSKQGILEQQLMGNRLPSGVRLRLVESGEVWTRGKLRGKPTVIEFWATWCYPCRRTAEALRNLDEEFGDDVRIVGVSSEKQSVLEKYLEKHRGGYPIARDLKRSAHEAMFITRYPTIVVLNGRGRVEEVFTGTGNETKLRGTLENLVDE